MEYHKILTTNSTRINQVSNTEESNEFSFEKMIREVK